MERLALQWQARLNFPEADFWLTNKGTMETLGTPTKIFQSYYIGIFCPQIVLPEYGFYLFVYLQQHGVWKEFAIGTINWKYLRVRDVRETINCLIVFQESDR